MANRDVATGDDGTADAVKEVLDRLTVVCAEMVKNRSFGRLKVVMDWRDGALCEWSLAPEETYRPRAKLPRPAAPSR